MSLSGFKYLTKQGLHNLTRNKLMSIASIGVLTACLVITGVAALLSVNVGNFVDYLGAQNKVIVYMQPDADEAAVQAADAAIKTMPNILSYTYVDKDEAIEEMQGWMSDGDGESYGELLEPYKGDGNPLLASFRVTVDDLTQMDATVAQLKALPGLYTVDAPSDLAGTLVSLKNTVNIAGWGLVAVLVVVSLVVISNTIRITVFARRKEINIMKFVGATNGFIRLPFLVEGTAIGLISAALAFGLVSGAYLGVLEAVSRSGTGLLSNLYFTLLSYRSVWAPLLIGFVVVPAVDLIRMSFTDWDGLASSSKFIGLENYVRMFQNPDLWLSLKNNAVYFFVHLLMIPVELAFAVLLTSKLRAAKFYKTMVFMPYIINGVAISYAFSYFFSPINGAFDAILGAAHLDFLVRNWLSDERIVNFVLASVSLGRFSGYHVILFMAALQSLPQDVEEAARVDGAGAWHLFKYIQVPAIMLMVDFVLFDNIRGALQVFDIPFVMTSGGPGYASSTFTLYTINTAFTYSNFGLASTMAVAIMVMIVVIYVIQNKIIHGVVLKGGKK